MFAKCPFAAPLDVLTLGDLLRLEGSGAQTTRSAVSVFWSPASLNSF